MKKCCFVALILTLMFFWVIPVSAGEISDEKKVFEEELLGKYGDAMEQDAAVYVLYDMVHQGFVSGTTMSIPVIEVSRGDTQTYSIYIVDEWRQYSYGEYHDVFSDEAGVYGWTLEWDIPSDVPDGRYDILTYTEGVIVQSMPIHISSTPIPVTELSSGYENLEAELEMDQVIQIIVQPYPLGATTERNIVWTSSDPTVAVVEDADLIIPDVMSAKIIKNIRVVGYGSCVITASLGDVKTQLRIYVPDPTCPFKDVSSGRWYYSAVKWAMNSGYITGTSDTTFAPNDPMTRGMLVTVLYRAAGRPSASADTQFPDVDSNKYYAKAISWAAKENLVSGYSNGNFGPEDSITREQIAKILYRYAEYAGYDVTASVDISDYWDAGNVSPYAKKYMKWAVAEGFIQGSNNKLNPKGNATRAEIAAILKRFMDKY